MIDVIVTVFGSSSLMLSSIFLHDDNEMPIQRMSATRLYQIIFSIHFEFLSTDSARMITLHSCTIENAKEGICCFIQWVSLSILDEKLQY